MDIAKALESIDQKMQEFSIGAARGGSIAALVADLVHMLSQASAEQVYRTREAAFQARSTGGSSATPATPRASPVIEPQTEQTRPTSAPPPEDGGEAAAAGREASGVPLQMHLGVHTIMGLWVGGREGLTPFWTGSPR